MRLRLAPHSVSFTFFCSIHKEYYAVDSEKRGELIYSELGRKRERESQGDIGDGGNDVTCRLPMPAAQGAATSSKIKNPNVIMAKLVAIRA